MLHFFKKRQFIIISNLLEAKRPMTITKIAKICKVSARTIRTDLNEINDELKKAKITLIRKPGVGVWLEAKLWQLMELKDSLYSQTVDYEPFSIEERRIILSKKLLLKNKYTMASLSNDLYVSKSTVYNDLWVVEKWLNKFNLSLLRKQKYGIKLIGSEQSIREAMVQILFELMKDYESEKIINLLKNNADVYVADYPVLCDFCEDINLGFIKELIDYIERERKILFSRESILYLSLYTAVCIKRIKAGKLVKDIEMDMSFTEDNSYELVKVIAGRVSEKYGIILPDEEVKVNTLQVLSSRLYKDYRLENRLEAYDGITKEILPVVVDLIFLWESQLNLCLRENSLVMDLTLYLRHLLICFRSGIKKEYFTSKFKDNFVLDELKKRNSHIFEIIQTSTQMVKNRLGFILNNRDINYIAILVLSDIERKTIILNKKKCLLITDKESPFGKLLINRMNQILDIEIVDVICYHEINSQLILSADIIISDKAIDKYPDLVVVSPLVTRNEINLINERVAFGNNFN